MIRNTLRFVLAAALGIAPIACAVDENDKPDTDGTKTDDADYKAEAWDPVTDNPNAFASNLEYTLANLPREGVATNRPWASSYWPSYEDSINVKWGGSSSDSAVAKYAKAFGLDPAATELKVSQFAGIERYRSTRTACDDDSACNADIGESCAKRAGTSKGVCIPTWWGICHAWSPLAVMMPEPKHEVSYNGVTFKVNDIKAMMILAWNSTESKFVSTRCEENTNELARDAYGRPSSQECRNSNAGTVHTLLTNYLGLRHEGFVYDRTLADEVWNQPIRSYHVTMQDQVTARQANELLGVTAAGGRQTSASGSVAKDVWYQATPVTVAAGEGFTVTMSGSNDADLYVNFGSQPTDSAYACRPYTGGSAEECALTVPTGVTKAYVAVKGYAASSSFQLHMVAGGSTPDSYVFNTSADALYHVKLTIDFITEASASTDGYLGDNQHYIAQDNLEYILEVKAGKVVGGEWVGASKNAHPDFLWLPISRSSVSVANGALDYAKIKMLYDLSVAAPGGGTSGGGKRVTDSFSVAQYAWKNYGPFNVSSTGKITVTMTGDNDADLYVRKGSAPSPTAYDCRPYQNGSAEQCTLTGGGTYYVGVRGYAASSAVSITTEYDEGSGGTTTPPPGSVVHLNLQDAVADGEMKFYTVNVLAGQKIVVKTFSSNDVDIYVQMGSDPTRDAYLMRAWTTSGNETITYTPTSSGTLHIGVDGYEAGSFTLRTSDN
jgi:transglutaminase elicitor/pre-peptidase